MGMVWLWEREKRLVDWIVNLYSPGEKLIWAKKMPEASGLREMS